jgi:short-subunit dehydrogenase
MTELDGQRALAVVTGASSGIGLALAHELAGRGCDLIVAAETDTIHQAAAEIGAAGTRVQAVQADLATFEGVVQLFEAARGTGRPIDIVALNAGVGVGGGSFVETPIDAHLGLIRLNVSGAVHLAHLVLEDMVARDDGALLFTSSIAATMPGPYMSTYNASKAFLWSFSEALRTELKDTGISVTALMPGPTDTNFFERADIEDTKLGQSKKDDPAKVARDGIDALLAGKDKVVAGSFKNKVQASAAQVLPDAATAAMHGAMSKPGSGG